MCGPLDRISLCLCFFLPMCLSMHSRPRLSPVYFSLSVNLFSILVLSVSVSVCHLSVCPGFQVDGVVMQVNEVLKS